MIKQRFDIYLNTVDFAISHIADCVIVEQNNVAVTVGFRYRSSYLDCPQAFAIDPIHLPLSKQEYRFDCQGGVPGFIDDYLPDAWGRKVLAQLVRYRHKQKLNANSTVQVLQHLGTSRIGGLLIVPTGTTPTYDYGCDFSELHHAENAAAHIDERHLSEVNIDELSLLHLANAGTGVGGARPKALIQRHNHYYLAKFNRLSKDDYNNARVELACLNMANAAGLNVFTGEITQGANGREVLLLQRFDIDSDTSKHNNGSVARRHLITLNALLKEEGSQRDIGDVFSYDHVANILRTYSCNIEHDLSQLLTQMLFNRAINNTDDHERNFSLMYNQNGYQLSPAYDMVPTLARGEYHAAGFAYSPYPPKPSDVHKLGKIFGLPKTRCAEISERVIEAVTQWPNYANQAGVSEQDTIAIHQCLNI